MQRSIYGLEFIIIAIVACSCSPSGNIVPIASQPPVQNSPQDWTPPVFPGAVSDQEIQASMTAVAATPEALDENACICFGFPVHNARFYAYRAEADPEDVMDFYAQQMAARGWNRIAADMSETTLPHLIWQQGESGPLVAYLMVTPMEKGGTLIYLSVAESESPRKTIEE
jgi:hypothetical protein